MLQPFYSLDVWLIEDSRAADVEASGGERLPRLVSPVMALQFAGAVLDEDYGALVPDEVVEVLNRLAAEAAEETDNGKEETNVRGV